MKMKAFIFSIEALLTLLASLALLYFALPATSPPALGHERVYENALLQDFLETGTKNRATLEKIREFGGGSPSAKIFLEQKYARLIEQTGADCLVIEMNGRKANACRQGAEPSGESASGTRLVYDGALFFELRETLFFQRK